jgi:hypothetical protein
LDSILHFVADGPWEGLNKENLSLLQKTQVFLVAGEPQISNFLEGYELVVDLWKYMNRLDD